jgi:hypothetical protein
MMHWQRCCSSYFRPLCLNSLAVFLAAINAAAQGPSPVEGPSPQAPPTPPAIQTRAQHAGGGAKSLLATPYSIGQPTDEEQLYLEYLNRMRANPTAEGQRLANTTDPQVLSAYSFFSVDLTLMQYEFSTNPAVPPLAMNAELLQSAWLHSSNMFANMYQGHYETNGTTVLDPGARITAQGYDWWTWGENVYAYSESVFYGHAGFAVDWGGSAATGGMQDPAGHRENMLDPYFREVGMGVVDGVNGSVGPQLITQDLSTLQANLPFITGVVYYDFNSNAFYDLGEGIGGVTVTSPGSSYYCVTPDSGGYALPVSSNGTYTLIFSGSGLSNSVSVVITNLQNVKADFVPAYSPPAISGPNPAVLNQGNAYTFSPVGGATAYQWQQEQSLPYTAVEGAENGSNYVVIVSSSGYSVLASDIKHSGSYSFHLAQPDGANQYITLDPVLAPTASSVLSFYKQLGWATTNQAAQAQITTDGGATWQTVWSDTGTGTSGDSSFVHETVSLAAYAGQVIQVRFAYVLLLMGNYYYQTSSGVGLYLDDISVSNASQLSNPVISNVASGTAFTLTPTNTNSCVLQVRAQIGPRTLNWGPKYNVAVSAGAPVVVITGSPTFSNGNAQIAFSVQVGNDLPALEGCQSDFGVCPGCLGNPLDPRRQFLLSLLDRDERQHDVL